MTISRTRVVLAGLAAVALPIAPACSGDDKPETKAPTTQTLPDSSNGNVPAIKVSMECGSRQPDQANDPEAFDAEHILLTNNDENIFSIEHFRLPTEVRLTDDSSQGFVDAVNLSTTSIGPVVLPRGEVGSAMIIYPGEKQGKTYAYFLDQDAAGTITLTNETELDSSVATSTEYSDVFAGATIMYLGDKDNSSFLDPGKDEWNNVATAPPEPSSSQDTGFAPLKDGNGAFLNQFVKDQEITAGAQVYDPIHSTACVAEIGPIARAPRAIDN